MPLEMDEADGAPRPRRRYDEPKRSWWRPASRLGRIFLGVGIVLATGSLVTAYLAADHFLRRDPRFRIAGTADIESNGLIEVPRQTILPVFGADIGKNIFFVHLSDRRKQLEQIPWVESAAVMRLLPNQIRVSIVERKPVAFVREGQQIELVDANGVLLNMSPASIARHHYSFPVLTGIDAGDSLVARRERMALYMRLINDLDSAGQHLSNQISEIDLTDPEDARVLMPEQGADILAHFGDEQFLTRYQRYKAHIAEWRAQYPNLAAVDLRYDQQVVLKMAGENGATSTVASTGIAADPAPAPALKPSPATPQAAAPAPANKPHVPAHKTHAKPVRKSAASRTNKKHPDYRYAGLKHKSKTAVHATAHQGQ
jgi:cell division protein FtsQ